MRGDAEGSKNEPADLQMVVTQSCEELTLIVLVDRRRRRVLAGVLPGFPGGPGGETLTGSLCWQTGLDQRLAMLLAVAVVPIMQGR
jgi:hypothetical protein